ncbi:MAG TPA: PIG-L deacetylase family protein [Acidimicrobiales bacterium]
MLGAGGTVIRHISQGGDVGIVFVSDGAGETQGPERDDYVATRKREARAAAERMGAEILAFLDHPDGDLCKREAMVADELGRILHDFGPDEVFTPFPTDHHRDHQATAAATVQAINRAGWDGTVWGYEVWSPLWPNAAVDVGDVLDDKVSALQCHESQLTHRNYIEGIVGLNRYRGLRVGTSAAEAFYRAPAAEFARVCAKLTSRI